MSDSPDVVVVGAGIVGASIAYVLARDGLDVVLMDGEGIGSGSTGHGHGVVSLVGKDFRPGPHFELGLAGARIFKQFTEMLQEDCGIDPMYHEKPGLSIAILEEEERIFREAYARLHDMPLGLRWVDGRDARAVEPRLSEEVRGGVLYWHGQVDAYRMTVCEAQALERLGGRVLLRRATGLLREGDRVVGVRHTGGQVKAGCTVLAMGAWSGSAEEWLDFPIPVRPLHGEVLNVRLPGEPLKAFVLTARHGPILQRKDGVILVGSIGGVTMSGMDVDAKHVFDPEDPTPPVFDLDPRPENGQLMIERGLRVMPSLEEADLVDHLAGVRPLSADRIPIIGFVPGVEGAILATGHGTKGIHLAPITARMVEDLVLHGENRQPVPYETFLPDRFAGVSRGKVGGRPEASQVTPPPSGARQVEA